MTEKPRDEIEFRIQSYIFDHKLPDGAPLPAPHELAQQFNCDKESLVHVLQSAVERGKLSYEAGTWNVVSPQIVDRVEIVEDRSFSLSYEAHKRKSNLQTKVLKATIRLPTHHKDNPFYPAEKLAQEILDLPPSSPFIVIQRLRRVEGSKAIPTVLALQQAYLNPVRFPKDFLSHDFSQESLISLYQQAGYRLLSRDTTLVARLTNPVEKIILEREASELRGSAVLDVQQSLYAEDPKDKSRFVLEFLKSSYLENWVYEIKNRPGATPS